MISSSFSSIVSDMSVGRTVLFCGSFMLLRSFLCVSSLPVRGRRSDPALQVNRVRKSQEGRPCSDLSPAVKRPSQTANQDECVSSVLKVQGESETTRRRRCGVLDLPSAFQGQDLSRQQRRKRFSLFGGRWEKNHLTYKIIRFPQQMSEDKVRRIFQEAFGIWSAVTPLRFTEVIAEIPDIIIDFNRYWHGDDLPFDGPGGILAHAFFPRTHREGEVHFDYDESWTVGNSVGTDLLHVAAHEFGHVLGLQHSLEPNAVMCPFYSDDYPLQLSEDDKRGIQYLYGPPQHIQPEIVETNEISVEMPDACRTNFDAVSMIRGELFFFKAQYVWRIRDGKLEAGYPALSSRHWKGIPDHVDAAYEDKSGNIWFFQGDTYWVFDAEQKITGPESVQKLGLPVMDIQAALKWEDDHIEKVYFFKSGSYWTFNVREYQVEDVRPRSLNDLVGVPDHIDGAFLDRYGYANFLSGLYYWKFDPIGRKVVEGFPRTIGGDFFGCSTFLHK